MAGESSLQFLQGEAIDWGCTEISIDGLPFTAGFTSMDWKGKLTPEMLYVNGSPDPQARTRGKAEYEASGEMPQKNYEALIESLGGTGDDGLNHMSKSFEITVTARPKNDPRIYTTKLENVRITEDSGGGSQGSASMAKLSFSVMKIRRLPPS